MSYLFTSESVTEGHPDKICDQISDTVLDAILQQDPDGACCCECFTTTSLVVVGGEISTSADIDLEHIARSVLKDIGYTDAAYGIDSQNCKVLNVAHEQSTEIAQGENTEDEHIKHRGLETRESCLDMHVTKQTSLCHCQLRWRMHSPEH